MSAEVQNEVETVQINWAQTWAFLDIIPENANKSKLQAFKASTNIYFFLYQSPQLFFFSFHGICLQKVFNEETKRLRRGHCGSLTGSDVIKALPAAVSSNPVTSSQPADVRLN